MSTAQFRAAFFAAVIMLAGSGFSQAPAPPKHDEVAVPAIEAVAAERIENDRQSKAIIEAVDRHLKALVAARPRPDRDRPEPVLPPVRGDEDGEDEEPEPPAPTPAAAEELVTLSGPETVATGGYFFLSVKLPPAGEDVAVRFIAAVPPDAPPAIELLSKNPGETLYLYQQVPRGVYRFEAEAQVSVDRSDGFDPHDSDVLMITVGGPRPPEPDPDPDPDPDPPDPDPEPDTAPFPASGLHVLIVIETQTARQLPMEQQRILYSKSARDFLNAKTATGPDGRTKAWRIYDADVDVSAETEVWQKAMAVPRQSEPWLVISNGRTGFSGPLPADLATFQAIVNEHAE